MKELFMAGRGRAAFIMLAPLCSQELFQQEELVNQLYNVNACISCSMKIYLAVH
jgi:hypothetical protein